MAIHLCGLPGDIGRAARPLLGLAPGGVCRADRVTPVAGALLPHRFTLTCAGRTPPSAVCFLWHFPAGHPDWPLASTLPCGAPTFLDVVPVRRTRVAATRPTHRLLHSAITPASGLLFRRKSGSKGGQSVVARSLGPVHGHVGRSDELVHVLGVLRVHGHANARPQA